MLRADTLKIIQDTAIGAAKAQVIELPDNQLGVVIAGRMSQFDKGELVRHDTVATVSSLVQWCLSIGGEVAEVDVWVSTQSIEVVLDATLPHRNHRAVMALTASPQIESLAVIGRGVAPAQLVRIMRTTLVDCIDISLLPIFRQIDFQRIAQNRQAVKHTGETLGRSVETMAQSKQGEIPEYVTVSVPVYAFDQSPRALVRLAVEADAERGLITWLPTGGGIEEAQRAARAELAESLRGLVEELNTARVFVRLSMDASLPLFDDPAIASRNDALERSAPHHTGDRGRIMAELARRGRIGATRHELAAALGMKLATVCGRVNELKRWGHITEGERRQAAGGSGVVVRIPEPKQ